MQDGPKNGEKKVIIIAAPSYDARIEVGTALCITRASQKPEIHPLLRTSECSSLTRGFNALYSEALNERKNGVTHFAMIHSDVVAEHGWLDKMVELMDKHGADILSAIIPLKSKAGYVSTGLDQSNGAPMGTPEHYAISNLSLHELYRMKDATFTDDNLLVNTGLMLVDIRKPWAEKVCFRFENEILNVGDEFKPFEITEDWYYSRAARALGARIFATREVKVKHIGRAAYPNTSAWGTAGADKK